MDQTEPRYRVTEIQDLTDHLRGIIRGNCAREIVRKPAVRLREQSDKGRGTGGDNARAPSVRRQTAFCGQVWWARSAEASQPQNSHKVHNCVETGERSCFQNVPHSDRARVGGRRDVCFNLFFQVEGLENPATARPQSSPIILRRDAQIELVPLVWRGRFMQLLLSSRRTL